MTARILDERMVVSMARKWSFGSGRKEYVSPYVHPGRDDGMLNRAGGDGYSFDEKDDERLFDDGGPGREYYPAGDIDEMREESGMEFGSISIDGIEFPLSDRKESIDPVFFCEQGEEYDFDAILADTEEYKKDERYRTDLCSMYGLGFDLDKARSLDIREYPGCEAVYRSICNNLAYTLVNVYAQRDPDHFKTVTRNMDIPYSEAFNMCVRKESVCLQNGEVSDLQGWLAEVVVSAVDELDGRDMERFNQFEQRVEYASHYEGISAYDNMGADEDEITEQRVERLSDLDFGSGSSGGSSMDFEY